MRLDWSTTSISTIVMRADPGNRKIDRDGRAESPGPGDEDLCLFQFLLPLFAKEQDLSLVSSSSRSDNMVHLDHRIPVSDDTVPGQSGFVHFTIDGRIIYAIMFGKFFLISPCDLPEPVTACGFASVLAGQVFLVLMGVRVLLFPLGQPCFFR